MKLSSLWLTWRRLGALVVLQVILAGCIAPPQSLSTPASSSTQKSTSASAAQSPAQLIVKTESGSLEGVSSEGVIAFKGIPYAAPPIGDLRWRAPQPVQPWTDVRKATEYGHDCMQMVNPDEPIQTTPSEDCLFVNVWQPAERAQGGKLPVMVWVHGGGYVGGGSSIPYYDGSAFARQGIVVVSFNYRLGRFGFFAHPALLAAKEGQVGNFGYMDQIAALKWVQTNIGAFGGDPQQVTLVGESAGGASVLTLLTSPVTKGLFHRVMIMSGGGRQALITRQMTGGTAERPSADQIDASFAQSVGVAGNGADALAALRALPAATIVGDLNLEKVLKAALLGTQIYPGTGMVDGVIVTEPPQAVFERGGAANVPIIIGTTAVDLPLIFPPSKLDPFAYFGADAEAARAAYKAPATLDQNSLSLLLLSIGADMTMHEPARFVAKAMAAAGNPAWLYRFTYTAETTRPQAMGQGHAGELPFLFDTLAAKYGDKVTAKDQQMAHAFNTYVGNFVKTGDPNGHDLPAWPKFDPAQFALLNFTLDNGPVFGPESRPGVALVERAADQSAAASTPEKPAAAAQETTTMTTTSNAGASNVGATSNKLIGTVWQWQKTQMSNDTSTTPDDPTRYTLTFRPDGDFQVRADCNRGRGVYKLDGNRLTLGDAMLTRMACPPGSLDAIYMKQLGQISGYLLEQGNLVLELKLDTGTMIFAPAKLSLRAGQPLLFC
ncbi:MAG: carboxylesterase family protein [Caldilineaceae bacterium]